MNTSSVSIHLNNQSESSETSKPSVDSLHELIVINTRITTSLSLSPSNHSLLHSNIQLNMIKSRLQSTQIKHEEPNKSTIYKNIIKLLSQVTEDPLFVGNWLNIFHKIEKEMSVKMKESLPLLLQKQLVTHIQKQRSEEFKRQRLQLSIKISQSGYKKGEKLKILQNHIECQSQQFIESTHSCQQVELRKGQCNKQNEMDNHNGLVDSKYIAGTENVEQKYPQQIDNIRRNVSINLSEEESLKSSLFSSQSSQHPHDLFNNIHFPQIILNQDYLAKIFGEQSFFFINLSLCILSKYIISDQAFMQKKTLPYLLGIAVIVAYKIFYDEPLTGLIEYYGQKLGMQVNKLIELQIWFLKVLKYELVISNKHYYYMMTTLLKQ